MAWNIFGRSNRGAQKGDPQVDAQVRQILGPPQGGRGQVVNNSNYRTFSRVNSDIASIIDQRSVVSQVAREQMGRVANPTAAVSFGDDFLAIPVATNKN